MSAFVRKSWNLVHLTRAHSFPTLIPPDCGLRPLRRRGRGAEPGERGAAGRADGKETHFASERVPAVHIEVIFLKFRCLVRKMDSMD